MTSGDLKKYKIGSCEGFISLQCLLSEDDYQFVNLTYINKTVIFFFFLRTVLALKCVSFMVFLFLLHPSTIRFPFDLHLYYLYVKLIFMSPFMYLNLADV